MLVKHHAQGKFSLIDCPEGSRIVRRSDRIAPGGGFLPDLFKGSSELIFGLKSRGFCSHPDLVLSNPRARKMPYAPAIAIGTLLSFFAH